MIKLSIIVPTLNNEKDIQQFFDKLNEQKYPKNNIEIICVDGGSKDKTNEIAIKNKARVINNPYVLAEPGVAIGMNQAKGCLIMILATDNYFLDKNALNIIVKVFDNKKIAAAIPEYDSEQSFSIFSKYHNIFTDPFSHFVYGNASNLRTFHKIYITIEHNDVYDIYDFKSYPDKPLMALAQGFILRRQLKRQEEDKFDDIQPIMKIINQNQLIACIFSVKIFHNTTRNLDHFMRKQKWATHNALMNKKYGIKHRLNSLSPNQLMRIKLWPFYAFSIIFPLIRSLLGVIQDKEFIWLFHPINCFLSAWASLSEVIMYNLYKVKPISRQ